MIVVGLGPGDWDRLGPGTTDILLDPAAAVVVRTLRHPAAEHLGTLRPVTSCDDLYERFDEFEEVYEAIAQRVASLPEPAVYAVPGSPLVGEFAVAKLRRLCLDEGRPLRVVAGESFLDAVWTELGIDPFRSGFQLLNGHELPSPLVIDKPTVIGHLDRPLVLADVCDALDRVLGPDEEVTLLADLGTASSRIVSDLPSRIPTSMAGLRTSMFVGAVGGGLVGAVKAMERLRRECPWDREQTHESLVRYLVEESHELIDAIAALGPDPAETGAYADVEEELGDVLLQVLFHAVIASERGGFDIDDVGEQLRRKLVRRHPHVFGDVEAEDAATVKKNWTEIKATEKQSQVGSLLDGIPGSLPSLARAADVQRRAASVGFDWPDAGQVLDKLQEEVDELSREMIDQGRTEAELGDVLFSIVNLARHLDLDPELALHRSTGRFERRFRRMEENGPLAGLTLEQLDSLWEAAKGEEDRG